MNIERQNFKKEFFLEILFIVLFLSGLLLHFTDSIPEQYEILALGVVGILGITPVIRSAIESLREKKINVDLLATIALLFSFLGRQWTSMLFINLMLTSARLLDLYTKRRARISLEHLAKLKPSKARVIREDQLVVVPLTDIKPGDIVEVGLGEQIPVDGFVIKGEATIDQSSLTGESVPVLRAVNDRVLSATVVASGNIAIRTERVGTETTFERMITLVESAQNAKTRMKTLAERFASWYISIMLVVAVALYMISKDVSLVLSVVLVVCADDIAIAIPLAYIVSIGTAARHGIVVKAADFLDRMSKISTLVLDKTGTITIGKLVVRNARSFEGMPLATMLFVASSLCQSSTHPVSKAIRAYAEKEKVAHKPPEHYEEKEGRGIKGTVEGVTVTLGRIEFLREHGIQMNDTVVNAIKEAEALANNVTLVAINEKIIGMFSLADEIREDIRSTISSLRARGVSETIMLTGDNEAVAKAVAQSAGVDTYYAELLPENKVSVLAEYINPKKTVAMVGDGVNDAAVLARADVGIAMGGIGSDAAIESADVVLMTDDFEKIIELRDISDRVLRVAYQNFVIWGIVNSIGLYFVFTGVLDPPRAAAFNFITDFIPIMNSLRLVYYRRQH